LREPTIATKGSASARACPRIAIRGGASSIICNRSGLQMRPKAARADIGIADQAQPIDPLLVR